VVIASGADLESANPLVTVHPLARQIQRYALFVTLARYDSLLAPEPYYARQWHWSADRRRLTLDLYPGLRWHDGKPTTAQDVAFTLRTALNPATGFFRRGDLRDISSVEVHNDTSLTIAFAGRSRAFHWCWCDTHARSISQNSSRPPCGPTPSPHTRLAMDPSASWSVVRDSDGYSRPTRLFPLLWAGRQGLDAWSWPSSTRPPQNSRGW
jgi:hypothetical protein